MVKIEEPILDLEEYYENLQNVEEPFDAKDEFTEMRDAAPLDKLVLSAVEGAFTHVSEEHHPDDVSDSISALIWDYQEEILPYKLPDSVPEEDFPVEEYDEIREKFFTNFESKALEVSDKLYRDVRDEAEDCESISDLQELLETRYDELGLDREY